jgi:hypothetical protein
VSSSHQSDRSRIFGRFVDDRWLRGVESRLAIASARDHWSRIHSATTRQCLLPFEDVCIKQRITHLLLGSLCRTGTLNAVATLDNICLQAYRPRSAVEFEEQATGIAEHGANLVSSPEGSRRGSAVLARRLCGFAIVSSHCCHGSGVGGKLEVCYRRRDCAYREGELENFARECAASGGRSEPCMQPRYDRGK